jgi:hypothetical protein
MTTYTASSENIKNVYLLLFLQRTRKKGQKTPVQRLASHISLRDLHGADHSRDGTPKDKKKLLAERSQAEKKRARKLRREVKEAEKAAVEEKVPFLYFRNYRSLRVQFTGAYIFSKHNDLSKVMRTYYFVNYRSLRLNLFNLSMRTNLSKLTCTYYL